MPAIDVRGVGKRFRRYRADRPHTLQEVLAQGFRGVGGKESFWALRDITFSVAPGRAVGIIGTNGSGKSTLLRLVGGIGRPDEGRIAVAGRIGALLDLASGFHTDLTGRENAVAGSVMNGLTRAEALRRLGDIIHFSELESFIDSPMRTYSSGMQMRLAFATAVHTDPDVLLIDEVLAVGDGAFQRKCLARISRFKERGCSLLLVSHGMGVVQEMCDDAIWLNGGTLMAHGAVPDVVREYSSYLRAGTSAGGGAVRQRAASEAAVEPDAVQELAFSDVTFVGADGQPLELLPTGGPLRVVFGIHCVAPHPLVRLRITRDDGLVCYDIRTEQSVVTTSASQPAATVCLEIERVDLNSGRYRVDVWGYARDWIRVDDHWTGALVVLGDGLREAALNAPHRWTGSGRTAQVPAPQALR